MPAPHRRVERAEVEQRFNQLAVGAVALKKGNEEGEFFAVVREMDSTGVLLDANHPLCGQDITFEIHLLEVTVPGAVPYRNGAIHAAG
ncbi:MAG: hypothetical protein EHM91_04415 [Planctomycetota bacterium]|nr:MAG: hypothetical protein EHM91_04415 [Planctomycetota bacterium]